MNPAQNMERSNENPIDKIIDFFSPSAGLRRAQLRERKYEAADRGRRNSGWNAGSTSATAETIGVIQTIADRSREQYRNNSHTKKAIRVISNNVVGPGIKLSVKSKSKKAFDAAWEDWAETTDCDFDGCLNYSGLQALAIKTVAMSGNCLIIQKKRKFEPGKVPLQLQLLEFDYLTESNDQTLLDNGGRIIHGIEFNKQGKRVAYWLRNSHPGDTGLVDTKDTRVPAKEVLHLFDKDRPGQEVGVPFGTTNMVLTKSLKDYEDAELEKQKVAASFAAFVQKDNPEQLSDSSEANMIEKIQPGMIQYLMPGETMSFSQPPSNDSYDSHTKSIKKTVAAGFGVTYEAMTGDYSQVNFSSGRMGWIEGQKENVHWQLNLMIPKFCSPSFQWFVQSAMLAGVIPKDTYKDSWTPPKREMLDPIKEIKGMKDAIRAGLISHQEAARELGWTYEQLMEEIASDNAMLDLKGIVVDSDPRQDPERLTALKPVAGESKQSQEQK